MIVSVLKGEVLRITTFPDTIMRWLPVKHSKWAPGVYEFGIWLEESEYMINMLQGKIQEFNRNGFQYLIYSPNEL